MPRRRRVRRLRRRLSLHRNSALLIKDKARPVARPWVDARRGKVRFGASPFSSVHGHQVRAVVGLREAVRHLIVRVWTIVVVHIQPVPAVRVSRHVREWVRDRVVRRRECRPNRLVAQGRNRAVRDRDISMDLKKVR